MRKALVMTVLAGLLLGTAAMAAPVEVALYPGLNMIAPPCVPFDPNPEAVFVDSTLNPINVDGKLIRFDTGLQGYVIYDIFAPELYGKVLLGDGAWLDRTAETTSITWKYDGVYDGVPSDLTDATTRAATMTDMWISLPKAGATLLGCPFNHSIPMVNIKITDGTQTVDLLTARDVLGWTDANFWVWNPAVQGYEDAGPDPFNLNQDMVPGAAYWLATNKDNLALIIPAN